MFEKRDSGLDVVRCFAIVSLPVLHSFMWAGLYSMNSKDTSAVLYTLLFALRYIVYCVVPLFMMLTGYLNCSIEMNCRYLKKIMPVLFSYFVISIFAAIYMNIVNGKDAGVADVFVSLLDYTANPYSWYVEMYIGLFLLAPFMNVLWNQLEKNQRKWLVLVLVIMTFGIQVNSLFMYQDRYVKIDPAWWGGIYPLAYYFVGKWIREYRPHISKGKLGLAIAVLAMVEGMVVRLYSNENGYNGAFLDNYCSATCALMTTLLFIFLYDIKLTGGAQKFVANISQISFEIYLFTYITDNFIWAKFNGSIYSAGGGTKIVGIIVCIISSFVIATLFAEILCVVKRLIFHK